MTDSNSDLVQTRNSFTQVISALNTYSGPPNISAEITGQLGVLDRRRNDLDELGC
jgi:hypothetical protein